MGMRKLLLSPARYNNKKRPPKKTNKHVVLKASDTSDELLTLILPNRRERSEPVSRRGEHCYFVCVCVFNQTLGNIFNINPKIRS